MGVSGIVSTSACNRFCNTLVAFCNREKLYASKGEVFGVNVAIESPQKARCADLRALRECRAVIVDLLGNPSVTVGRFSTGGQEAVRPSN